MWGSGTSAQTKVDVNSRSGLYGTCACSMLLSIPTLKPATRGLTLRSLKRRYHSSRASTVLSALEFPGTSDEIPGVYDGEWKGTGEIIESVCPSTKEIIGRVRSCTPEELQYALMRAREAYLQFRHVPAPRRGEIVRQIREAIAAKVPVSITVVVPKVSTYAPF
ncbi:hypothetical protein JB92DRAFT_1797486 [Gautieria morchelliformis]|nr:hypothetical protein JB92DRAFT_1797486 [Gautieria morchelliformis]